MNMDCSHGQILNIYLSNSSASQDLLLERTAPSAATVSVATAASSIWHLIRREIYCPGKRLIIMRTTKTLVPRAAAEGGGP